MKIAVVGYTDPDVPLRQPPGYSKGLRYDGPEALPALVREVREQQQADVVLLMTHMGLSKAVALADRVPGVDAHLSARHARAHLRADRARGQLGGRARRLRLLPRAGWTSGCRTARWSTDVGAHRAAPRRASPRTPRWRSWWTPRSRRCRTSSPRVVGHADVTLARYAVVENPLDNVLADAIRAAGGHRDRPLQRLPLRHPAAARAGARVGPVEPLPDRQPAQDGQGDRQAAARLLGAGAGERLRRGPGEALRRLAPAALRHDAALPRRARPRGQRLPRARGRRQAAGGRAPLHRRRLRARGRRARHAVPHPRRRDTPRARGRRARGRAPLPRARPAPGCSAGWRGARWATTCPPVLRTQQPLA